MTWQELQQEYGIVNWFDKTDEEIIQRLKNVLRTEDFQFIGKYEPVPQKDFGFFKDVRSLSGVRKFYPKDDGSTDERKIRPLEIYTKAYDKLIADKWYKFYAVPAANPLRKSKRNPFLLQTDWKRVRDIFLLRGKELIDNIKNDALNTPEGIAGNLMRAIETISIDINTEPTTFIFELIQNADDYPNSENNVSITFRIDSSHLIIKHNGSNFEVNNMVALCGVNEGDKREDKNKIGFKGIGFKSIFKDANFAYIKSGDFSFRFDEEFWSKQGIEIFWHITPINTSVNEFKQVLKTESNVNIVIRPKALQALKTYRKTFATHFNDERILLFLRNVKSLIFDSAEEKFEISNSSSKWRIFTESSVEIPENETNELNRRINFPDRRIPVKFYDITLTELGFGFRISQNKVQSIGDGFIYAYLPTKVNLGFSFILNGNFIPDASRTKIYSDLTWNSFLFEKAGELFIKQITSLLTEGLDKESVLSQIPSFSEILLNIKDDDKIVFINCFKKGFEKEIIKQHFIPIQSETLTLEPLSNIIIDETGFVSLLGEEFSEITKINKKLIDKEVGKVGIEKVKILIDEYGQGMVFTDTELVTTLKSKDFESWLQKEENNIKFWNYVFNKWDDFKDDSAIKSALKNLPVLCTTENTIFKTISKTYLSTHYIDEDIKAVIENIPSLSSDVFFISNAFISEKKTKEEWVELFRNLNVTSDLQKIINDIIDYLDKIDENHHFDITLEIFKFWKKKKKDGYNVFPNNQLNILRRTLKLKSLNSSYTEVSGYLIGDYYNDEDYISGILPSVKLDSQISADYHYTNSRKEDWKEFFKTVLNVSNPVEKQEIFEAKIKYWIDNQDSEKYQNDHYKIVREISDLYKDKDINNLTFRGNLFSGIKLRSGNNENWLLPSKLHFSSEYKPELDLQADDEVKDMFDFLSSEYQKNDVSKELLKGIGVAEGFVFIENYDCTLNDIVITPFVNQIVSKSNVDLQSNLFFYHFVNYYYLLQYPKYFELFIKQVIEQKKDSVLLTATSLPKRRHFKNLYVWIFENYPVIQNQSGSYKNSTELYSYKLEKYISDKDTLPESDYTKFKIDHHTYENLEEIIGINQKLSEKHCIELLSNSLIQLTQEEVNNLEIVKILADYTPDEKELETIQLPNKAYEWVSASKLFTTTDELFQIESTQHLHDDFRDIAENFKIPELSEENLELETDPKYPEKIAEILDFFENKARYIAFKMNQEDWESERDNIIENIKQYDFFEVSSLLRIFPKDNPVYSKELNYYCSGTTIYYKDHWKSNKEVIDFLYSLIEGVPKNWFKKVITHWNDQEIIKTLDNDFGETPFDLPPTDFIQEVEDFIAGLEQTQWSTYIPELKNILQLATGQPKEKQKLFNLMAKVKLAKQLGILFTNSEYNQLENGSHKYFVHSARGAFAYIHPNEIMKMKNGGYKMALDFGANAEIKIYDTTEEILQLHTKHLLLYQGENALEGLLDFCERNQTANNHLLIIDRENSIKKSTEILKLLNSPDDYR